MREARRQRQKERTIERKDGNKERKQRSTEIRKRQERRRSAISYAIGDSEWTTPSCTGGRRLSRSGTGLRDGDKVETQVKTQVKTPKPRTFTSCSRHSPNSCSRHSPNSCSRHFPNSCSRYSPNICSRQYNTRRKCQPPQSTMSNTRRKYQQPHSTMIKPRLSLPAIKLRYTYRLLDDILDRLCGSLAASTVASYVR
jgi:hypothetical protein